MLITLIYIPLQGFKLKYIKYHISSHISIGYFGLQILESNYNGTAQILVPKLKSGLG